MQDIAKDAPQSARRQPKHHKPRDTNRRNVQSDNDMYEAAAAAQSGDQTPVKKGRKHPRKQSDAARKKNGIHSDVGEGSEHNSFTKYNTGPGYPIATPVKALKQQAYAGGAFQNSPEPSALPIPSFMMSKSVPKDLDLGTETTKHGDSSSVIGSRLDSQKPLKESTALDWMFDLARNKDTPMKQMRAPPLLSSPADSPSSRSPAGRDGGIEFPFELDGAVESRRPNATPFSQRLSAAATPRSTSLGGKPMTDEERRAKTEALKRQLLNGSNSPAALRPPFNDQNPFNAKDLPTTQSFTPRHSSNPSTPFQNGHTPGLPNQYFPYMPQSPTRNNYRDTGRPQSSGLRNIYDPSQAPLSPPPTVLRDTNVSNSVTSPPRNTNFAAIYGVAPRPHSQGNTNPTPETNDDGLESLRKALKMLG